MPLINVGMQVLFFAVLCASLLLLLFRVVVGPHVLDRVMCLDLIAMIIVCLIMVYELTIGTADLFDSVLVISIVGFLTTVAFAKYLESGQVVE